MFNLKKLKIMNLKNLNVQELSVEDKINMSGGIAWLPVIVGAAIGVALTQDLDALSDAFNEGYNDAMR